MPIRLGDPGVFVCGPGDIAPWETERRRHLAAVPPPPPRRAGAVWLVLALCPRCVVATGYYCHDHGPDNWWLSNWGHGVTKRKSARPGVLTSGAERLT